MALAFLTFPLLLLSRQASAAALHDFSPNCTCYAVNTTDNATSETGDPVYFQYHRFYDFRNVADSPYQYTTPPAKVNSSESHGNQPANDPKVLNSQAWNDDWSIQSWGKKSTDEFPIRMQNSMQNVYIMQRPDTNYSDPTQDYTTYLTLRTSRTSTFQSSAEIENLQKNVLYTSVRMKARVQGSAGGVASIFTYYDDDNESDVEILTKDDGGSYHFTNQPSVDNKGNEIKGASQRVDGLPSWQDWQTWRIDWTQNASYWWIDGQIVANSSTNIPKKPSGIILNMWSDGGTWSGKMESGQEAVLQVQWVEMVFNTSGTNPTKRSVEAREQVKELGLLDVMKRWFGLESSWEESQVESRWQKRDNSNDTGCAVVCRIDSVNETGHPEIVPSSGAGVLGYSWTLLTICGLVTLVLRL